MPSRISSDDLPSHPVFPSRPDDAHKGTFGRVAIFAGSRGMSGAASLAGRAALHGGAGLVTVVVPESVLSVVAAAHPSYMTVGLAEDDAGRFATTTNMDAVDEVVRNQSALATGPGLGRSIGVSQLVEHLYAQIELPLVLDADGLNAFGGRADELADHPAASARVLTPHLGEFARLTGLSNSAIAASRVELAERFANDWNVVLLLKGPQSVITDGRRTALNRTGNASLATGGTGDVLTGLIVALIAQGLEAWEAARTGAYLHGLAADLMVQKLSPRFATSSDLVSFLNDAWRAIERGPSAPSRT